jgi:hypothetical protein
MRKSQNQGTRASFPASPIDKIQNLFCFGKYEVPLEAVPEKEAVFDD